MTVDLAVEWQDTDLMGYNTIAEIPGTDLKDEIVMLGGHMDSWHAGTGATDNGAGVAVAMEAVRIIQALDLKPRRTIRIALWSGEEQGCWVRTLTLRTLRQDGNVPRAAAPGRATHVGSGAVRLQACSLTKPEYENFSSLLQSR